LWEYHGVKVHWLGHDSIVLEGSKVVMIDPFKAKGDFKADILLISHEHSDHLSPDDIARFTTPATVVLASKPCEEGLKNFRLEKLFVSPGSKDVVKGVTVETIPAYNLNKFRSPGNVFHPKADGRVGWVVTMDGAKFYHAGDADAIPEMGSLDVDVAFLPVSGTYVMTAREAADAARTLKTKVVIPMHFNSIVGTSADAEEFKKLVGSSRQVEILQQE
jgi:L-ascorbate metabolism protein UlaG (beta-lactamase superfamily)